MGLFGGEGEFWFWYEVTPGGAQGSLLVLHSGITPFDDQGTIWDIKDRTKVGSMQDKDPLLGHCTISNPEVSFLLLWNIFKNCLKSCHHEQGGILFFTTSMF